LSETTPEPQSTALDVIVGLLPELDDEFESSGTRFFDRLCEAVCRLVGLERAGLVLYDEARRLVVPVGSHGIDPAVRSQIYGTLDETPMAQTALTEDRVVEISENLSEHLPARYAQFAGVTTLVCTPVSAAGRWLGVIFADRGGGPFSLTDDERQTMYAFGKAAALAASTRLGAFQAMRARELSSRLELARDLHERVVQRLFGLSLALGSEHELTRGQRDRCATEIQEALADLRTVVSQPHLTRPSLDTGATLREELARLGGHYEHLPIEVKWEPEVEVPPGSEALAQSLLAEALRNCDKHAHPTRVTVKIGEAQGAFFLEISNDGSTPQNGGPRGTGMGLKLAALEAIQSGGMVEFGPQGEGEWRVRLVLPGQEVAE
jgi:signal transduction histidine kinase